MLTVRKAIINVTDEATARRLGSTTLVDRDGLTKPLIQIVGEEAIDCGADRIGIVTTSEAQAQFRRCFESAGDSSSVVQNEKLTAFVERVSFIIEQDARSFVGDEPVLSLNPAHVYISDTVDRCARQLIDVYERSAQCDVVSAVQPVVERLLHQFHIVRGRPVDAERGIYLAEQVIAKPSMAVAREQLITPGLPAGNYLAQTGMHVFGPGAFENGGRTEGGRAIAAMIRGQRFDITSRYGLLEAQLALGLSGIHRNEICELVARTFASRSRS